MYIARFKTAHNQKEMIVDAKIDVDAAALGSNSASYKDNDGNTILGLPVGTMVSYDATNNKFAEVKATVEGGEITAAPAITAGNYILAQSDATMSNGHVPVETLSYKYVGANDFVGKATVKKPIAVYQIIDVTDVVVAVK